ncbi:MAG: hypothetical protein WCO69_04085 [Candidatus Omnitrophota bacterium]
MNNFGVYKNLILRRVVASLVLLAFLLTSVIAPGHYAYAQAAFQLPAAGTRIDFSPSFTPPVLKGIKVYPENPFRFDFILDKGNSPDVGDAIKDESLRLVKYFMASLTVPEKDLWVNLSPYEKDRIVPEAFGQTEMGRDILAQDYILKQITASAIYPEGDTGKKFWARVYQLASEKYGTTDIPLDTFNKVWIVPQKAVVYENAASGTAYIVESKLKVMLESDYLALEKNAGLAAAPQVDPRVNESQELAKNVIRDIVLPLLEREVNEGGNFIRLRQVFQSLILAAWYKKKIKDSLLSQVYSDKNKISGVSIDDPKEAEKIWAQYVEAFKKGVYNYIKEEKDPLTDELIPRKYFSGGVILTLDPDGAQSVLEIKEGAANRPGGSLNNASQNVLSVFFKPFFRPNSSPKSVQAEMQPVAAPVVEPVLSDEDRSLLKDQEIFRQLYDGKIGSIADMWREVEYRIQEHPAFRAMFIGNELTDQARSFFLDVLADPSLEYRDIAFDKLGKTVIFNRKDISSTHREAVLEYTLRMAGTLSIDELRKALPDVLSGMRLAFSAGKQLDSYLAVLIKMGPEAADAAKELTLILDGGISSPGPIYKALAHIGSTEAVDKIEEGLKDARPERVKGAVEALRDVRLNSPGEVLPKTLVDLFRKHVRESSELLLLTTQAVRMVNHLFTIEEAKLMDLLGSRENIEKFYALPSEFQAAVRQQTEVSLAQGLLQFIVEVRKNPYKSTTIDLIRSMWVLPPGLIAGLFIDLLSNSPREPLRKIKDDARGKLLEEFISRVMNKDAEGFKTLLWDRLKDDQKDMIREYIKSFAHIRLNIHQLELMFPETIGQLSSPAVDYIDTKELVNKSEVEELKERFKDAQIEVHEPNNRNQDEVETAIMGIASDITRPMFKSSEELIEFKKSLQADFLTSHSHARVILLRDSPSGKVIAYAIYKMDAGDEGIFAGYLSHLAADKQYIGAGGILLAYAVKNMRDMGLLSAVYKPVNSAVVVGFYDRWVQKRQESSESKVMVKGFSNEKGDGNYSLNFPEYGDYEKRWDNAPDMRESEKSSTAPVTEKGANVATTEDNAAAANGGIDLAPDMMDLQVKNGSGAIKFNFDPAMIEQMQNAPGFTPEILDMHPLNSVQTFLGLSE